MKETGRPCGKNSSHWKSWFTKLDLSLDVDVDGEVLVADIESDCDECDCDDFVSDTGSPLITDDDRRLGPADHDQQSQGGPEKSKHFEVIVDEATKIVCSTLMYHQLGTYQHSGPSYSLRRSLVSHSSWTLRFQK